MSVRVLRLRWPTSCSACGQALAKGATVLWSPEAKAATCQTCSDAIGSASSVIDDDAESVIDGTAGTLLSEEQPAIGKRPEPDRGVAGGSARREFERRSDRERGRQERAVAQDAAWRERVVESRPVLGRVATLFTPKPVLGPPSQRSRAWLEGAAGEELLGRHLAMRPESVIVFHDRRIPGSTANIDHLAVAASGVFVIDAKNYDGRVEVRDVGPWHRVDEQLFVAGRNRTSLVAGVERQVLAVRSALAGVVPVRGALCFVGENWPAVFRRPLKVRDVLVAWPTWLVQQLGESGPLQAEDIQRIADEVAAQFPAA